MVMVRNHTFRLRLSCALERPRSTAQCAAICLAWICFLARSAAGQSLQIDLGDHGLRSLKFAGVSLLKEGQPRIDRVVWADTGETFRVPGNARPQSTYDQSLQRLEQNWEVGRLNCVYHPEANRLNLKFSFTNTTKRPMRSLEFSALRFEFPATPKGPGWYRDLHGRRRR
jgi:hypothetical protein